MVHPVDVSADIEPLGGCETSEQDLTKMTILSTFAEAMSGLCDLDEILQLALATTMEMVGMDQGGVLLLDPSSGELLLRAHIGGAPELVSESRSVRMDEGSVPRMLPCVTFTDDLSSVTMTRRRAMEQEGLQSLLSVPLVSGGHPVGMIVLAGRRQRRFAADELAFLAIVGRHIGSAIHRAQLQAQELRAAILEERQAMARQMHDDIAQTLGYLGLYVDNVMDHPSLERNTEVQAELLKVRTAIDKAYHCVRTSITQLSQDIPGRFDLRAALQKIINEFESSTECRINAEINLDCLTPLSPVVAMQASHIIQEALRNTQKHARARIVHLTLRKLEDERIEIIIADDGQGFDAEAASHLSGKGYGLRFMRERAEQVGGAVKVESVPRQGTRVTVHLPLHGGERT